MKEETKRCYKKSLTFKKSGEKLSVQIELENISNQISREALLLYLETLFEKVKIMVL